LTVFEVKTGFDPQYSGPQMTVYPMAQAGYHVYASDAKKSELGFIPGERLPPMRFYTVYKQDPDAPYRWLEHSSLLADERETPEIFFAKALFGPLLGDETVARALAELILTRLYGEAELARQQPLQVTDDGIDWLVRGAYQEVGKPLGNGSWFIRARKSDCRVEKFGHLEPRPVPEEVEAALRERQGHSHTT
jgi:hypothetical protein